MNTRMRSHTNPCMKRCSKSRKHQVSTFTDSLAFRVFGFCTSIHAFGGTLHVLPVPFVTLAEPRADRDRYISCPWSSEAPRCIAMEVEVHVEVVVEVVEERRPV